MVKLSPAEQQALRARAHALDPVVMIGDKGLSDALVREIDRSLKAHELIKIRVFVDDRDERSAIMAAICEKLDALPIQRIGKILVVYRENPEQAKKSTTPAKAPRKAAPKDIVDRRRAAPCTPVSGRRVAPASRRRKI